MFTLLNWSITLAFLIVGGWAIKQRGGGVVMFQIFRKMGGHNKMELVEITEISIKWGGGRGGCAQ